ncbi:hypothetical protein SK128_003820 [Halocaridina rubra]|uniref:Arrestin C-terminal-like domain-containing protein n=1 Tax=Halocaridina rubra TaxID=373956 RepID=A0AAN9A3K5_HALRR
MGFDTLVATITPLQQVYFSGQVVQGVVQAAVSRETSCREITVTLIGKGKVHWTERRNKRTYTYSAEEEYGRKTITLWHGGASNNKIRAGHHSFPFVFELPYGIPSSFETDIGRVYYKIKAVADIPWGIDMTDKTPFAVHNILDLNRIEEAMMPISIEHADDAGCCTDMPVSILMQCDRRGYVPGEKLFMSGVVSNNSLTEMKYSEAKIVQNIKYHATSKTKEVLTTVQRVYRPSIRARGKDTWSAVPLTIPAVATTDLQYCNIIDISYELKFLAKLGFCSSTSTATKLIIGSVPIQRRGVQPDPSPRMIPRGPLIPQPNFNNMPYNPSEMASAPMLPDNTRNDQPPPYTDLPPPSYEESKHMTHLLAPPIAAAESDDDGFNSATPRYEKPPYL